MNQPKATIRRLIEDVFNRGHLQLADELLHPDYAYRSPVESMNGPAEFKAFVAAFRSAFPDLRLHIKDLLQEGEATCLSFSMTGTHRGDFFGVPATGKAVALNGMVMSRFKDGRIHQEWELLDNLSLFQQLGLAQG